MARAVLVLASIAVAVSACGGAKPETAAEPPPVRVEKRDHSGLQVMIVGASEAQERLLREILDGVDPAHVDKVVVEPVEEGWAPHPENAVQIVLSGPDTNEAAWARILVAGAFMDRSADAGLPTVEVFGEHGASTLRAGFRSEAGGPRPIDDEALSNVATAVAEGASAAGARVEDIAVSSPWGNAIAVTLSVDDPAPFLAQRFEKYFDRGSTTDEPLFPDGSLLQVRGPGNEVIYADAYTNRLSTRSAGIPHRLEGCFWLRMSRPSNYSVPPCPL
jgi:hypothetical protein